MNKHVDYIGPETFKDWEVGSDGWPPWIPVKFKDIKVKNDGIIHLFNILESQCIYKYCTARNVDLYGQYAINLDTTPTTSIWFYVFFESKEDLMKFCLYW